MGLTLLLAGIGLLVGGTATAAVLRDGSFVWFFWFYGATFAVIGAVMTAAHRAGRSRRLGS